MPSTTSDNITVALPPGTTFSQATSWLAQVISARQSALFGVQTFLSTLSNLSSSDRAVVVAMEQTVSSQLNLIAIRSLQDQSMGDVLSQTNAIVNMQILQVDVPQERMLARVDSLAGAANLLVANENSAESAIAVTHQSRSAIRAEEALGVTVQSLAHSVITSMSATQKVLLAVTSSDPSDAFTTFTATGKAISAAYTSLQTAQDDLGTLVGDLAGI
jgi:hypothetical protein